MPRAARIPSQLWLVFATLIGGTFLLSDLAPKPSKAANHPDVADLGATAHQAMIEIFRNRDTTAIDRFFSEPFVQHDPNIADGLSGLKAFAAEVASSPTANVTTYRTLVDGDIVMLHSKYEGLRGFAGPVIAFDLFRFKDGKIVEHWGGQDPEVGPNLSGHTQVDGPTAVVDRDRTEANRALVRAFKQIVTVELRLARARSRQQRRHRFVQLDRDCGRLLIDAVRHIAGYHLVSTVTVQNQEAPESMPDQTLRGFKIHEIGRAHV